MAKQNNLVIIGSHLWDYPEKHAKTSFCVHIDEELPYAGGDIDVYAFEEVSLGLKDNKPYLRLPNGTTYYKGDKEIPEWCLCYVVPPRAVFTLEQIGIKCYSSFEMLSSTEDKMISHVLYADIFAQPDTLFYTSEEMFDTFTQEKNNYPFMLKGVDGCCGDNVSKADTIDDVSAFMEKHDGELECNMMQKLMPTADDLRVYILGDEIIGAVVRRPKPGIWKSNLKFEPKREVYTLSVAERDAIIKAMEKLPKTRRGLHVYDFLFNKDGDLVFCESNCNVGTDALDSAGFGENIFLRYVDYIRKDVLLSE